MLNCFIPNNNIKFPWGSFRDNCTKHILLNISRSSPRIWRKRIRVKVFFYLLIGTSCFHFYRLEKDETKSKLFQSELCQFWGIYAREIQLVTGEMCFTPISARGISKFFSFLRESNSWRGIWRWGNSQKTSHFPGRNTNSLAGNTISLAGSSYIFEGMFPLNKEIFFLLSYRQLSRKKQKIYPQKHAYVNNYICVYSKEIVFD